MSEFEPQPEEKKKITPARILLIIVALAAIGIGIWQIIRGIGMT